MFNFPPPTSDFHYDKADLIAGASVSVAPIVRFPAGVEIDSCFLTATETLPPGLTLDRTTCVVSGTPTSTSTAVDVSVIVTDSKGGQRVAVLHIGVVASPPILKYGNGIDPLIATVGSYFAALPQVVDWGVSIASCSAPDGLPLGLAVTVASDPSSPCAIVGTPSGNASTGSYRISASNVAGSRTILVPIEVKPSAPLLDFTSSTVILHMGQLESVAPDTLQRGGAALTCALATASPTLSAGLTVNASNCKIEGTPSAITSVATYTVTATNAVGSSTDTVNLRVDGGVPTLSFVSTNGGSAGTPAIALINQTFALAPTVSANGSTVTACTSTPTLPTGLVLNSTTCALSGTSTGPASNASYTISATNGFGTGSTTLYLRVSASAPTLIYSTPVSVTLGQSTSLSPSTLNANGGTLSGCVATGLPTGLTIDNSTCVISGVASGTVGAASVTVTASNAGGSTAFTLALNKVAGAPSLSYANPSTGTTGTALTWTPTLLTNGAAISGCVASGLPAGLAINNSTCVVSGTPTGSASSGTVSVTATNSVGSTTATFTATIVAGVPTLAYSSTAQTAALGQAFSFLPTTLTGNGSAITNCQIIANVGTFPAGLSINPSTCVISGTPTAVLATTTFSARATNAVGASADASWTLTVGAGAPTLSYASSTGTTGSIGNAMSVAPSTLANNGSAITACGIKTGSANAGSFPGTLSVNATTCVISGTPSATLAATTFTLVATNAIGTSSDATVSLTVGAGAPSLSYASSTGTTGSIGNAVSVTPSTLANNGSAITACGIKAGSTNAGTFPGTLSVNATTCAITGTPSATLAATTFTLVATNAIGASSDATVTLTVGAGAPSLSYATSTGTTGSIGNAMSVTPSTLANNGSAITACGIKSGSTNAGSFPGTLSVNATTCVISGTPAATLAATTFTLVATNAVGTSSDATVSLTVGAGVPSLSYATSTGTTGAIGSAMNVAPSTLANNGSAITACGIKSGSTNAGSFPGSLSVNASTCVISGTPAATLAATTFTLVATNAAGTSSDATVSLTIAAGAPALSYASSMGTSGTVGTAMSVTPSTLTTNGSAITSCGIKSGSTNAGLFPSALSVNATTCVISGTPVSSLAATTYTLVATNAAGTSSDATVSLTIGAAAPSLSYASSTGTSGTVGTAISVTPSTLNNNGAGITACGIKSGSTNAGSFPGTLSVNASTCVISGTPTATLAATTFTLVATNSAGTSSDATVSLTISAGVPQLTFADATAAIGDSLNVSPSTLNSNGSSITNCRIKSGSTNAASFPGALSVAPTTCVITGTVNAALARTVFTLEAINGVGASADVGNFALTVGASSPSLAYNAATIAIGQAATITPSVLVDNGSTITNCAGTVPAGLSVNSTTCVITGTPTGPVAGAANYSITVTNGQGSYVATASITITAGAPALSYASSTGTSDTVGTAMSVTPSTLTTNGSAITACGIKSGSTNAGLFPSALSVNATTCVISGTPVSSLAATTYTLVATNAAGTSSDATVSLTIGAAAPSLSYTSSTGTSGTVGTAMSVTPSTLNNNGAAITACGIKSGSNNAGSFPGTLSVNASTCVISGTPTATLAATTFTLVATNSAGTSSDATVSLTIGAGIPSLSYASSTGTTGTVGTAMSVSPSTLATNGSAITACGIKSGSTNAGSFPGTLSVNASTCVISGTPSATLAATTFTLVATNAVGTSSDATVSLTIGAGTPSLSYASSTGTTGSIGSAMSVAPSTLAPNGSAITACGIKSGSTNAGSFPGTLSVNASTCVISGTPSAALAATTFTLVATNSVGTSSDATVSLTIAAGAPTLSYASSTGTTGSIGSAMSVTPSTLTTNGSAITACGIKAGSTNAGSFPGSLSVNATTCVISGTPAATLAATTFTLVATNAAGTSSDATVSLTIGAGAPSLSYASSTGTSGTVGSAMSVTPSTLTTNGSAITACGIKSGSTNAGLFPSALSVNATTCVISGTPVSSLAATTYTLVATNAAGTSSDATVSLTIGAAAPSLSYASSTGKTGTVGTAMSVTPSTLNNNGAGITACGIKSGSTNAGTFPGTLSVNASTCVISGTPSATLAATTFTLVATNSAGTSSDATVSLTVNASAPTLSYASSTGTSGTLGTAMSVAPSTLTNNGAAITACGIKSGSANAGSFPGTLSVNASTCVISGTPSASLASTTFTLVATNAAGTSSDATVTLAVAGGAPLLSYASSTGTTVNVGSSMSVVPSTLTNNGLTITSCQIKPGSTNAANFPSSLSIDPVTCIIGGTPSAPMAATTFTIVAKNSGGTSADAAVTLQVTAGAPLLSYYTSTGKSGLVNAAMTIVPSTLWANGSAVTGCAIKSGSTNAGLFPAAFSVNATTCVISGTPTATLASTIFTLVATNAVGTSNDATITLQVNADTSSSITSSGLVMNLDASKANGGTGPFAEATGAPCGGQTWTGIGPSGHNPSPNLNFYSGCSSTNGFVGNGSLAAPYRIALTGPGYSSISVSEATSGDFSAASFTNEMWVRRRGETAYTYLTEAGYPTYNLEGYSVSLDDGKTPHFCVAEDGGYTQTCLTANSELPLNTWAYLVVSYDSASRTLRLYVNGTENATPAVGDYVSNSSNTISYGYDNEGNASDSLTADFGKVAAYSRALTAAEIATNCQALAPRFGLSCTAAPLEIWPKFPVVAVNDTLTLYGHGGQSPYTLSKTSGVGSFTASTGVYSAPATPGTALIHLVDGAGTQYDATVNVVNPSTIVTSNLQMNLDAATANGGTTNYAPGCSAGQLTWFDASGNGKNTTLQSFSSCGPSLGWLGNGTPASPYRIAFNGGPLATTTSMPTGSTNLSDVTIETWVNIASTSMSGVFVKIGTIGLSDGYSLAIHDGTNGMGAGNYLTFRNEWSQVLTKVATPLGTGWKQITLVLSGDNFNLYVNGALVLTAPQGTVKPPANVLAIGSNSYGFPFTGEIAKVAIYNTQLGAGDVARNCTALKSRFIGVNCSISTLDVTPQNKVVPWTTTQAFKGLGGLPPYTYAVTSGASSVNATTGIFTAAAVNQTGALQVTDSVGNSVTTNVTTNQNLACEAGFCGGTGTPSDPYLIGNAINMCRDMVDMTKSYKLIANIDFAAAGCLPGPYKRFSGTFDGNGKTLSNITYTAASEVLLKLIDGNDYYGLGLFASIHGGTVKNLRLSNVSASTVTYGGYTHAAGGLVGILEAGGTVQRVLISSGSISGYSTLGGLVGLVSVGTGSAVIDQSASYASVSGWGVLGGLIGSITTNDSSTVLTDSYAQGSVTSSANYMAGSLIGQGSGMATFDHTYATGAVAGTGNSTVGGFVGRYGQAATNSLFDKTSTGQTSAGDSLPGYGVTTSQAQALGTYASLGFDLENTWGIPSGGGYPELRYFNTNVLPLPPYFAAGDGSAGSPYQVSTVNGFYAAGFAGNAAQNFLLTANIDFGGAPAPTIGSRTNPFVGTFDGNGKTLSNLVYNVATDTPIGIFPYVQGGTVKNLKVSGISVSGINNVGSLIGYMRGGTVQNVLISSGSVSGNDDVGGLVGLIGVTTGSDLYTNTTVFQSVGTHAAVSGHLKVGGFVGWNYLGYYPTGTVSYQDVYAQGSVAESFDFGGGFAGQIASGTSSLVTVNRAYATGAVTGIHNLGGFAGNSDGTITNSFWDQTSTGQSASSGAGAGAKSTAAAQGMGAYTALGFDFEKTWGLPNGGGYASLSYFGNTRAPASAYFGGGGDGSSGNPYQIANADDFAAAGFASNRSKSFVLTANIDFAGESPATIGSAAFPFTGTFDGGNYTLSNINFGSKAGGGASSFGLFPWVNGGTVKNLKVSNITVNAPNTDNVGALIGLMDTGTVDNVVVRSGAVTGYTGTGGLVGTVGRDSVSTSGTNTITGSGSHASVSGYQYVGGAFGRVQLASANSSSVVIQNSYAQGATYASSSSGGGFIGNAQIYDAAAGTTSGFINRSYATGAVTGVFLSGFSMGGITVTNSFWDTTTSGQSSSSGGTGYSTGPMQTNSTYTGAGWTTPWTLSGGSYPKLPNSP